MTDRVSTGSSGVPAASRTDTALALAGVSHRFGSVQALTDVSLAVHAGEVHALVGENGAGKSTLLRIVAGLLRPMDGTVTVHGQPLAVASRRASIAAGVGVVHQHFSLVGSMTAVENFTLGRPEGRRRIDWRGARSTLETWIERTGLVVTLDRPIDELGVVERQRLEILNALGWGARVLLLDEPTAVLSPTEADQLLAVVTELAAHDGLAVVLVTHKLREVAEFARRATVLRAGVVVGRHEGAIDRDELVAEMIGGDRADAALYAGERTTAAHGDVGPVVVRVRGLRGGRLRGVDLDLRAGEVTGVAAVVGSGQEELVGALCGLGTGVDGSVEIETDTGAVRIGTDAGAATRAGVALIPADRARDALAPQLPVWVNAVAKASAGIGGWRGLDRQAVTSMTERAISRLGVRPASGDVAAGQLSGGNQQRLVIGRELDRSPRVVVAAEPTRGLDPASALAVIGALRSAADGGAAVLVSVNDLDELLLMSDRVVALCDGRVTLDATVVDVDRHTVGRAMAGV